MFLFIFRFFSLFLGTITKPIDRWHRTQPEHDTMNMKNADNFGTSSLENFLPEH